MIRPIKEIRTVKNTAKNLASKSLSNKDYKNYFRPIDYTRTAEIPAVLFNSRILDEKGKQLKILDISSPQILCATLSEVSKNWSITYNNPFQPELEEMNQLIKTLSLNNIVVKKIDITKKNEIDKLDGEFDYIFSVSVFEHIYPESNGDITAIQNIRSLLKKGGLFILSVPFYKEAFNEYKVGDIYMFKNIEDKKSFFQRFYDEESLNDRLIIPSGLVLESNLFLGERLYYPRNIKKRLSQKMQSKLSSVLLGKFFFNISRYFFTYSNDYKKLKKPYIAVISLRNK